MSHTTDLITELSNEQINKLIADLQKELNQRTRTDQLIETLKHIRENGGVYEF